MQWYALDRYVATLITHEHNSQAVVDQAQQWKYVGRKRLKAGGEAGGDRKNQATPGDDDDDDDDDEDTGDGSRNDESDAHLSRYCASFSSIKYEFVVYNITTFI